MFTLTRGFPRSISRIWLTNLASKFGSQESCGLQRINTFKKSINNILKSVTAPHAVELKAQDH